MEPTSKFASLCLGSETSTIVVPHRWSRWGKEPIYLNAARHKTIFLGCPVIVDPWRVEVKRYEYWGDWPWRDGIHFS